MEVPAHKIKASVVALAALGIGIGIPLFVWVQNQNVGKNLKGELELVQMAQVAEVAQPASEKIAEQVFQPAAEAVPSPGPALRVAPSTPAEIPQEIAQPVVITDNSRTSGTSPLTLNATPAQPEGASNTNSATTGTTGATSTPPAQVMSCKAEPSTAKINEKVIWSVQNPPDDSSQKYLWSEAATGEGKTITSTHTVAGKFTATVQFYDASGKKYEAKCSVEVAGEPAAVPAPVPTAPAALQAAQPLQTPVAPQPEVKPLSPNQSKCPTVDYPKDIENSPAKDDIKIIFDNCISRGYVDGNYRPELLMSRALAIKFILIAAGIAPDEGCVDKDCGSPYKDLAMGQNKWIRAAWGSKIIESAENFFPQRPVTRNEATTFVANAFRISQAEVCLYARQNCGTGNLEHLMTREEMATVVAKTLMALGRIK